MSHNSRRPKMHDGHRHHHHHRKTSPTCGCNRLAVEPRRDLQLVNLLMPVTDLEYFRAKVRAAWDDGEIAGQHYDRLDILLKNLVLRDWPEPMASSDIDPRYLPLFRWLLLSYSGMDVLNSFAKFVGRYIDVPLDEQSYGFMSDHDLIHFHNDVRYFIQIIEQNMQFERYGGPTAIQAEDQDNMTPWTKVFGLLNFTIQKLQRGTTPAPEMMRDCLVALLDDIHNEMRDRDRQYGKEQKLHEKRSSTTPKSMECRYGSVSSTCPEEMRFRCESFSGRRSPEAKEERWAEASGACLPGSGIPSEKLLSKDVRDTISELEDLLFKAISLANNVIMQLDGGTSGQEEEPSSPETHTQALPTETEIKTTTEEVKAPREAKTPFPARESFSEDADSGSLTPKNRTSNKDNEVAHEPLASDEADSPTSGSSATATSLPWTPKDENTRKENYFASVVEVEDDGEERGRTTSPRDITHHEIEEESSP